MDKNNAMGPIGVFDSGYGGLTILQQLRKRLPQYDFLYLGDNARAPYGSRSFEVVYQFTRQAVLKLFDMGCHLVILGCNTASAKALRSIQERVLPELAALTAALKAAHVNLNRRLREREIRRTKSRRHVLSKNLLYKLIQHAFQIESV